VTGGGGTIVEGTATAVPLRIPVLGFRLKPMLVTSGLTLYEVGTPAAALNDGAFCAIGTPAA
jgi:hypothetical protein